MDDEVKTRQQVTVEPAVAGPMLVLVHGHWVPAQ
jgi:hypothetical protein